jgi:hypothetical protein
MQKKTATESPCVYRITTVLAGSLVAMAMMLSTSSVSAQCSQWDARNIWGINQSNKIFVRIGLNQRGPRMSGNAYFQGKTRQEHGAITGSLQGESFYMEIKWDYGETGIYTGRRIEETGPRGVKVSYLVGDAYIKEQPDNRSRRTTWKSSSALMCYHGR